MFLLAAQTQLDGVKESAEACEAGPLANTVCRKLLVSCDSLKPIQAEIRITEPAAGTSLRGTVVMRSGGARNSFYAPIPAVQSLVSDVAAMDFRVVDRRWIGKGGKFVATGNSPGSAEIGYDLTSWQRSDILELAILSSGPPTARLDYACVKQASAEWASLCATIAPRGDGVRVCLYARARQRRPHAGDAGASAGTIAR